MQYNNYYLEKFLEEKSKYIKDIIIITLSMK